MGTRKTLGDRIEKLLSDGVARTPKQIAVELGANHGSVRKTLRRLVNEKKVKEIDNGFYVSATVTIVETKGGKYPVPEFGMHDIKFELDFSKCHSINTGSSNMLYPQDFSERLKEMIKTYSDLLMGNFIGKWSSVTMGKHPKNGSLWYRFNIPVEGKMVDVSVSIHMKKVRLIEVWIKSSKNPITLKGFYELIGWLKGAFPYTDESMWKITSIGLNKDIKGIEIEQGRGNALTVAEYKGLLERLYYKEETQSIRKEVHFSSKRDKAPTLDEALKLFHGYGKEELREVVKEAIEEMGVVNNNESGISVLVEEIKKISEIDRKIEERVVELEKRVEVLKRDGGVVAEGVALLLKEIRATKEARLKQLEEIEEQIEKSREVDGYQ